MERRRRRTVAVAMMFSNRWRSWVMSEFIRPDIALHLVSCCLKRRARTLYLLLVACAGKGRRWLTLKGPRSGLLAVHCERVL